MYRLYVIPGSHACRSAMLMLEQKGRPFEVEDLVTGLHPIQVRLKGFDAGGQARDAGGRRTAALRIGDRLGTVPGLADGKARISTNHRIARYLDDRHPDPPLVPDERRAELEAAEEWANETLQMEARRVVLGVSATEFAAADDGRLGTPLFGSSLIRQIATRPLRRAFVAYDPDSLHEHLPPLLDRVDGWIADGLIGTDPPNVADCMIAPSLALMLYRSAARPYFTGRPCLDLVDRLLPEPPGRDEVRRRRR